MSVLTTDLLFMTFVIVDLATSDRSKYAMYSLDFHMPATFSMSADSPSSTTSLAPPRLSDLLDYIIACSFVSPSNCNSSLNR